jgi:ubiquinone/menaquinone biosynthesis C-methylase UbiE
LSGGYDRSARAYDQTAGGIYLRALRGLLPYVNLAPSPSILDVGCGTAINLLEAARVLGPCGRLVGVDLSAGMLDVARAKAAAAGVQASFLVGDAEALELEDSAFDLVICNSAYHWFPDRARAVRELSRVLRPGGQLLLASIAEPGYEEWIGAVNGVWTDLFGLACPAFPPMPTAAELKAHVGASGLGIEHFKYQIAPARVGDVRGFLGAMAVIAPVWLCAAPEGAAPRVMDATYRTLSASPGGFTCTQAGLELVARKGAAIPFTPPAAGAWSTAATGRPG